MSLCSSAYVHLADGLVFPCDSKYDSDYGIMDEMSENVTDFLPSKTQENNRLEKRFKHANRN